MQWILQTVLYAVGLPLELLVVAAMLRSRAWRTFPFVFAYAVVALFLACAVEVPAYAAHFTGVRRAHSRAFYYWINEAVLVALVFAAVISLVYYATTALRNRTRIRLSLIATAVLVASLSVALHHGPGKVTGQWMTLVSRDLNFCAAALDLALWMILLAFRPGDHRLLLISGGLGVQFAGEAIGQSLRDLSRATVPAGNVIAVLGSLACSYVWWQTFRTAEAGSPALEADKVI